MSRIGVVLILLITLGGCQHFWRPESGVGKTIAFSKLAGWQQDKHAQAWLAWRKSCQKLGKKSNWVTVCDAANVIDNPTDQQAKEFFETYFNAHILIGQKGRREGLITGYYEPLLKGSWQKNKRFRFPLYRTPEDLLIVDLGKLYPALKGKRVRGRLQGNKVIPYFSRGQIDGDTQPLNGQELLWVDDIDAAFFLQIQGSGRVRMQDGSIVGVGYANQNGHAYVSIGKRLIQMGELKREDVNLFSIKSWLKQNPNRAQDLFNENPSYVFFALRKDAKTGPMGSLNVPLTAERSLAIDPKFIDLGAPIWLNTSYPDDDKKKLQRLVMAQDTGGAIKGQLRADLFWGEGARAEQMAGNMKQRGELYILLPK